MKTINEYLSAKVKKDFYTEFPKNKNLEDILWFLKENGFIKIERESETSDVEALENHEELIDKPRYIIDYDHCISFCNSGKLSKENPMFQCTFGGDNDHDHMIAWPVYKDNYCSNFFKSYKEFANEVNNHFRW